MIGDTNGPTSPNVRPKRPLRPNRNRPITATGGTLRPDTLPRGPLPNPQSTIDLPPLGTNPQIPNPQVPIPPMSIPPGHQTPPWGVVTPQIQQNLPVDINTRRAAAGLPPLGGYQQAAPGSIGATGPMNPVTNPIINPRINPIDEEEMRRRQFPNNPPRPVY